MVLNYIWIAFFIIAFVVAFIKLIFLGDTGIFTEIMNSTFDTAKLGFEISLGLTGVLSLWLGIMKIGERGGMITVFSRAAAPLFSKLFPDIPKGHPASASILMNISANMLGLDNAATPFGLKAMNELQQINPNKNEASNPMIMFLVLNASGLTLIPITVMVYRAQMGAANPSDIFIPIMIATFVATLVGTLAVCFKQRINIFNKAILGFFGGLAAIITLTVLAFQSLPQEQVNIVSGLIANVILFCIIIVFLIKGLMKKINVFDAFIDGAKEGFHTAVRIIPYLIALLVGIGVFRASGAMDFLMDGMKGLVGIFGGDTRWIDGMPTALMKPLSGSGARGMMIDTMRVFGADSFAGRLSSVLQGATDTTFYIVAVYYGAVNIKNSRYTVPYALLADLAGVIAAIFISYLFFG
ncbi:MAG: nucleoside recognition domain-containing protein [Dysgonamonadaceae bacterium]|jgi:spore maturation protein SpmA/spore maturation protein SpmB|nr:nucleoside recognition domain-containing protein [Dysgonamonadaceae bacterium]MDD3355659.1 nucleoside recognition domain-containing protein [Dysgonamonadaceae bacterium]MDD3728251.1 nucleoside recognition domain-containing protein [Dysgonamonadaceae bacterium]MDD4246014.1 nucleoside recognition domain-containing protein [Dysgonamonadaceae bacterium]MDD4605858.1 nucleoside recognition domain-containing protein [Dysgonamonadaceae bacterium]